MHATSDLKFRRSISAAAGVLAGLVVLIGFPQQAVSGTIYTYASSTGQPADEQFSSSGDSVHSIAGSPTGSGFAEATAQFGVLRAQTHSDGRQGTCCAVNSQAVARWSDTLTIAGPAGSSGLLTFGYQLTGFLSTAVGAGSNGQSFATTNAGTTISAYMGGSGGFNIQPLLKNTYTHVGAYQPGPSSYTIINGVNIGDIGAAGYYTFTIPYIANRTIEIAAVLSCDSSVYTPHSPHLDTVSDCSMGHTAKWGGLLGVTDSGGNALALSTLTLQSGSGFDYARQLPLDLSTDVPEPGTLALLCCGILALGLMRRRRPLQ